MARYVLLFIYIAASPLYAGEKDLFPQTYIGRQVLLMVDSGGKSCSAEVIKTKCTSQPYTIVTADHCVRPSMGEIPKASNIIQFHFHKKGPQSLNISSKAPPQNLTPSAMETPRNPANIGSCLGTKTSLSVPQEEGLHDSTRRSKKSLFTYNESLFKPLMTLYLKKMPPRLGRASKFKLFKNFKLPKMPRAKHRRPSAMEDKGSIENQDLTPPSLFTEAQAFNPKEDQPQYVGVSNLVIPEDLDPQNFNQCTDLAQFPLSTESLSTVISAGPGKDGVIPMEPADQLPEQGEELTILGYQHGCNPVQLKCQYIGGASSAPALFQPLAQCLMDDANKYSFVGVSGGAIINKKGQLVGVFSRQGPGKASGEFDQPFFAFTPITQSMIECPDNKPLIIPTKGPTTFPGFLDGGSVQNQKIQVTYDEFGCYENNSAGLLNADGTLGPAVLQTIGD